MGTESEAEPAESKPLCLLVEDSPTQRLVYRVTLESLGFRCQAVDNGGDALRVLAHNREIMFVLCDIQLPGMDGLELVARSQRIPGLQKLPFVMCTAKVDRDTVLEASRLGCTAFLKKPFESETLKAKIDSVLGTAATS